MGDQLDRLDAAYETAEAAFLSNIRVDAPRAALAEAAHAVAANAAAYNTEAYRRLHAPQGDERSQLDLLTERTEVLSELWTEIAAAYLE